MNSTTRSFFIYTPILLILIAAVLIIFLTTNSNANQTIAIGAILPLSGQNGFYGKEIQNAIELASSEINESGGINGKLLEVVYEDDKADPKIGVTSMQKLINIDKVPVVLGSWASGVVLAAAPIAEQTKTVVVAQAIAPTISQAGDFIFRIQPSAVYYTEELLKTTKQIINLNTLAIISINNEFGNAIRQTTREQASLHKIDIISDESYAPGDQDFRTQLQKINQKQPQALLIGGYQEQSLIIQQAREIGLASILLAAPTFENEKLINELGSLAEGVIYPYHFLADADNQKTIAYLKSYQERFGTESGGFAPLMYDGVHIIAGALKKCSTNTECIKNYLYNVSYDGVSGTITFDENGDPHLPIVIKTVKNGKFVKYE